jgi:hypothetical protein
MIFIVDLYVGCVYLNNFFEEMDAKEDMELDKARGRNVGVYDPTKHLPGLGEDFGFSNKKFPPGALKFFYSIAPTTADGKNVNLSISAPLGRIMEENIDFDRIMVYVADRIFDHYDFRRDLRGYHFFGSHPLKSTHRGAIWVKKEVAYAMQLTYFSQPSLQLIAFKKRKRSVPEGYNSLLSSDRQHLYPSLSPGEDLHDLFFTSAILT